MHQAARGHSQTAGTTEATGAEIKAVIVGDGGCGKTSLLMVFAKGDFPKIGSKTVQIHLWDTAGQEDYDRLRPLSYTEANIVLMCYDVTSPSSYDNILTKWYPEVNHFCKGVPIVLVGCKTDLRKDKAVLRKLHEDQLAPITYQKGESMAKTVHAIAYFECSAKFQENITNIFVEASSAALSAMRKSQRKRRPKRGCLIS
ncbi:rho-related GTP-binding protein RhoD isoform X2 [Alligator mississippiensis]|uniref:rho-related GTP-binding protein RhoD isoform X2 n=1 Tax=Alligator mississippiensis TaxID=8496 RepID=UPI00090712FB|nr:rho-related GTP-binding protein RhoD isoform X2 [Alligator mississippiensis]